MYRKPEAEITPWEAYRYLSDLSVCTQALAYAYGRQRRLYKEVPGAIDPSPLERATIVALVALAYDGQYVRDMPIRALQRWIRDACDTFSRTDPVDAYDLLTLAASLALAAYDTEGGHNAEAEARDKANAVRWHTHQH